MISSNELQPQPQTINANIKDNNQIINQPIIEPKIIPETTISTFFNDPFLSDAILKCPDMELPFHKIILCASSKFIYD